MIKIKTQTPFIPTNTVPFLIVTSEPRNISKVLKLLSKSHPMPKEFQHLKRVRKNSSNELDILIGHNNNSSNNSSNSSSQIVPETIASMVTNAREINIPLQKPGTREEYEIAQQIWPASFHANHSDTNSDAVSNPNEYIQLEQTANKWMQEAIQAAHVGNTEMGCIVVNPRTSSVVARSCDHTHITSTLSTSSNSSNSSISSSSSSPHRTKYQMLKNRLQSPVMCCIDIVAQMHAKHSVRAQAIAFKLKTLHHTTDSQSQQQQQQQQVSI